MTRLAIAIVLTALLLGCMSSQPRHRALRGALERQQQEAVVHDPYTNQNIAPEVVGGRPREYQKDFSEPQRSRLLHEDWLVPPLP